MFATDSFLYMSPDYFPSIDSPPSLPGAADFAPMPYPPQTGAHQLPMDPAYAQHHPSNDSQLPMGHALSRHLWPGAELSYPLEHHSMSTADLENPDISIHSPAALFGSWPATLATSTSQAPFLHGEGHLEPDSLAMGPPAYPPPSQEHLLAYGDAPRTTFPTPSELLTELASHTPTAVGAAKRESDRKVESQRKARQRIVADNVGFTPTDPDTISSHDKKRFYLECLEQYIIYLHDQLRLVGTDPAPLERVSTYRGLSSRSIRTMLVHMQSTLKSAQDETLEEEQRFLDLSEKVHQMHRIPDAGDEQSLASAPVLADPVYTNPF